jgi:hypothetical protein
LGYISITTNQTTLQILYCNSKPNCERASCDQQDSFVDLVKQHDILVIGINFDNRYVFCDWCRCDSITGPDVQQYQQQDTRIDDITTTTTTTTTGNTNWPWNVTTGGSP